MSSSYTTSRLKFAVVLVHVVIVLLMVSNILLSSLKPWSGSFSTTTSSSVTKGNGNGSLWTGPTTTTNADVSQSQNESMLTEISNPSSSYTSTSSNLELEINDPEVLSAENATETPLALNTGTNVTESEIDVQSNERDFGTDVHMDTDTDPRNRNQSLVESISRVFPVWNRSVSTVPYSWCRKNQTLNAGILYVKLNKCASSTGMGVTLRIADTLGRRMLGNNTSCFARYNHGAASTGDRQYLFRQPHESVLWSIVRHPASRVVSDYFFYQASRRDKTATESAILQHVQDPRFKTHYVDILKLKKFDTRQEEIEHLIQNYDFIAISERMEESLVVLSMILKVPLADVVVLNSKQSGGYDDGRSRRGCVKLKLKWTTPQIDDYLAGDFLQDNYDFILYQAANVSLDNTIDALGRDLVVAGVQSYRELAAKNEQECRRHAIFPCPLMNPNHTSLSQQDCYFSDAGCGHKCSDYALQAESDDEWSRLQRQWHE